MDMYMPISLQEKIYVCEFKRFVSGWVVTWFLLGYTVLKKWRTSFHTDVLS